jgi:hypothetical protein
MLIVGLCGKKQVGKDTFAEFGCQVAERHGVSSAKIAFASPLKQFVVDYCGVPQGLPWGSNDDKDEVMGTWGEFFNDNLCLINDTSPTDDVSVRQLLQVLGTDVFRNVHENFWVNVFKSRVKNMKFDEVRGDSDPKIVFITDMRFENEVVEVNNMGGYTIKLDRSMHGDDHKSEASVDLIPNELFSEVLTQADLPSLDHVYAKVESIMSSLRVI